MADKHVPIYNNIPEEADEISSTLANISPLLNDNQLYDALDNACQLGKFKISIGATCAIPKSFLQENDHQVDGAPIQNHLDANQEGYEIQAVNNTSVNNCQQSQIQSYLDSFVSSKTDEIYNKIIKNEIDLDDIMVSAVHGGRHQGVKPSELAKIWRIDENTAQKTLYITTQRCIRTYNPTLLRSYSKNGRMFRYKHL